MSLYFNQIRRLKDSHHYIQEITRQFALYRATQDQVDNQVYKAYNRATTNRLIVKEQAAAPLKQAAEFWTPTVPQEPGPPEEGAPTPVGTTTVMINFDHELEDRSTSNNDALFEFTNNQLLFAEGQGAQMNFAVNFNPTSNATFDKLWIPFSNSTQLVYDTPNGFSILTRIYPLTLADLGTQQVAAPAPLTNKVRYYGGPVLNKYNPQVINIYWGSQWSSGAHLTRRNSLNSAYATMLNSQHFGGVWQYGGIKKPVLSTTPQNIIVSSSSPPSSTWVPQINALLNGLIANGSLPNPESFGEPAMLLGNLDYRHIFAVHLPQGVILGEGGVPYAGGFAFRNFVPDGIVWYLYIAIPYSESESQDGSFNALQMQEQAWGHELFHAMSSPGFISSCGPEAQEMNGYLTDACNSPQHPMANGENCGTRLRLLSGTQVCTESYWSDMDGKCIAPGSGDSYKAEPTPPSGGGGTTIRRYIFQKMDDLDHGATAAIGSDGTVYFNVKKAGLEYKVKTAPGAVAVNTWADIWFTFSPSTNSPAIYVNNRKYTTPSTENLIWNNKHSHTIIGNYNVGATTGQFRGRMDEWRLYRNMLATAQQVDNFDANGLTITPVNVDSTQGVAIVNRCKIDSKLEPSPFKPSDIAPEIIPPVGIVSFTPTSFTVTSFTV